MSVAKLTEQDDLVADVKAILSLLKEREWAEHCTKSRPGRELESLITDMHNEIAELQQKLDALADKLARSEDYSIGVDAERMEYIEKFNAMAAENAALKQVFVTKYFSREVTDVFSDTAVLKIDGDEHYCHQWVDNDSDVIRAVLTSIKSENPTPATDTYLNSVRADAVETFAVELAHRVHRSEYSKYFEDEAIKFAANLRYGTHDTADKEAK